MEKKKIGEGLAGVWQKAADAAQVAKVVVQDMAADAKQTRAKKAQQKADSQKAAPRKVDTTANTTEQTAAPKIKCIATRNALSDGGGWNGFP